MILSAGILSSVFATAGLGDLLPLLLRVTLIASAGTLLCFLLRKASAAKRYLAAMVTLIVLIAFPAAKVLLPVVPLPILPPAPPSAPSRTDATSTVWLAGASGTIVPGSRDEGGAKDVGPIVSGVSARQLSDFVILLYLVVYAALLLHVLFSFIAAAVTARRAWRIDDADLRRDLESACRRLGVSRPVDIRESSSVTVPVVWGLFRPVILLPMEAREWSREQLRVVLLHEVAHVARHDALGLLLARIATSVFWFHPLVWNLARVARRESERCCDDLVLASGERATDYAAHLLAIVRSMTRQGRFADLAPALAQRSNLEGRLVSILHAGQRRDSVSRAGLALTIGLAALLLVGTTAVQVVAASSPVHGPSDLAPKATLDGCQSPGDVVEPKEQIEKESSPSREDAGDEDRVASLDTQNAIDAASSAVANWMPSDPSFEYSFSAAYDVPSKVYSIAGSSSRRKTGAHNESGIELMRDGQYAKAIVAFEDEIRESGSTNAMYNLSCAYALRGDKRRAFDALQNAIENGFDNTHHMTEDEDLRLLQGDPHFYQLVRLAQDLQLFNSGRFGLGMKDEEDWRRSVPRLERVTREHPDVGRAWSNLGYARLEAGDPKGATDAYERALDLGYHKPTTLYNLACCASRSGSIDVAFGFLDRADKAGFEIGEHMGWDTDLDALRSDPRYAAMLARWDEKMAKEHREQQKAEVKEKTD
jgi:beta-lactamase regulating signal transducer with metallopeptidase domain/tetratricopeptide (TPR) repeat protein